MSASALNRSRSAGFSLVELMIAMVAGLLVSLAAVAFFFSSIRSNTDYVGATRLTQELRNNLDYVTRELRRAGYNADALTYVSLPANSTQRSPFGSIQLVNGGANDSCVLFAYDRDTNGTSIGAVEPAGGERHGIRRFVRSITIDGTATDIGVIEVAQSDATVTSLDCAADGPNYGTYPPSCNTTTGWCALSDPRRINITALNITLTSGGINNDPSGGNFGTLVRDYTVVVSGSLLKDTSATQSVNDSIRIRSECLHTTVGTGQCVAAP
jgi:prepilin-type N-terminal cleavage/methylation domain-containing protein